MGNNKSKCSVSSTTNDDSGLLSDYDMKIYSEKREKIFWGTIAICVLYGTIALLIFLGSYFSESFKEIILNRFLPFTTVFIIGTILITFYLTYQVTTFKPVKINKTNEYDVLSCPDFWHLEKVPLAEKNARNLFDPKLNSSLFEYRCVMNDKIFNKGDIAKSTENTKNKLRIANSKTENDIINTSDSGNYNKNDMNLYTSIYDITQNGTDYVNYVKQQEYNPYKLWVNNMIMNNYALDSVDTSDKSKAIGKFSYLIGNDDVSKAREVNIEPLKYAETILADPAKTQFNAIEKKYVDIELQYDPNDKNTVIGKTKAGSLATDKSALNNLPIVCDRVYPLFLAAQDQQTSKDSKYKLDANVNRCAYAKACNIPWSELNCEKYELK